MGKVKAVSGEWGALATETMRTPEEIERAAADLLAQMTLEEKIQQMSGDTPLVSGLVEMLRAYNTRPLPAGENPRLGIPGIRFSDGPRGVVMYRSTCFPVSMGRGASFDPELEERIGDAIGVEARAQGANFFGGVCINLLRHPAWGRAQETYGEDPYHLGEMGAALVRGVQRHIMACAKHFAGNSIENTRFKVDVRVDDRTLHEVYLPHFKRCVDEGVAAIMSAYNKVNGEYCGHHRRLLREILKQAWGFTGFVMSDFFFGIRDAGAAALGGLDIEMPFRHHYRRRLKKLVAKGQVPLAVIDEAVLRILRQKLRFAGVGEAGRYDRTAVGCAEHVALARLAAVKSMVLLQNQPVAGKPVLPIDPAAVRRVALLGRLADADNTGDEGSSRVRPPYVITPLHGLRAALGKEATLQHVSGLEIPAAVAAARDADVAIIIAGNTPKEEGEHMRSGKGGDRASLTLTPAEEALIQAVAAVNPRTIVALIGGSAFITEAWREQVPAILMAWYPGMEGGHALAEVLLGKANPGGKLPCSFPKSEDQLPYFDAKTDRIAYGYYHGYRRMDKDHHQPAFPFGYGLSYTTFRIADLEIAPAEAGTDEPVRIRVRVTNTGSRPGDEVVQLYVGAPGVQVERFVKELKGFQRITLQPGETRQVTFNLLPHQMRYYNPDTRTWELELGEYRVFVGNSSRAADLLTGSFLWGCTTAK